MIISLVDFAIGAYKSNNAFIIKSYGIIIHETILNTSIAAIEDITTGFKFNICIRYSKRSDILDIPTANFSIQIHLDPRADQTNFQTDFSFKAYFDGLHCKPFNINLKIGVSKFYKGVYQTLK